LLDVLISIRVIQIVTKIRAETITVVKSFHLVDINYPFYPKNLKDSKKLLIFLDTLEGFVLTEGELITDTLRNESGKTIEDVLFSIRMANRLKNRIECSFIASVFKEE